MVPVSGHFDPPSFLVDCPVVAAAEENEVFQLRFSAIRPMHHVVCVRIPTPTAGKTAALVSELKGPADGWWHGPSFPAHI
jgi:hypothetical protein